MRQMFLMLAMVCLLGCASEHPCPNCGCELAFDVVSRDGLRKYRCDKCGSCRFRPEEPNWELIDYAKKYPPLPPGEGCIKEF